MWPHEQGVYMCANQLCNTTKLSIIQYVVSKFHSMCVSTMGKLLQSLLDSGIHISLMQQFYFYKHLVPLLGPAIGELAKAHNLFSLTVANDETLLLTRYDEFDVTWILL